MRFAARIAGAMTRRGDSSGYAVNPTIAERRRDPRKSKIHQFFREVFDGRDYRDFVLTEHGKIEPDPYSIKGVGHFDANLAPNDFHARSWRYFPKNERFSIRVPRTLHPGTTIVDQFEDVAAQVHDPEMVWPLTVNELEISETSGFTVKHFWARLPRNEPGLSEKQAGKWLAREYVEMRGRMTPDMRVVAIAEISGDPEVRIRKQVPLPGNFPESGMVIVMVEPEPGAVLDAVLMWHDGVDRCHAIGLCEYPSLSHIEGAAYKEEFEKNGEPTSIYLASQSPDGLAALVARALFLPRDESQAVGVLKQQLLAHYFLSYQLPLLAATDGNGRVFDPSDLTEAEMLRAGLKDPFLVFELVRRGQITGAKKGFESRDKSLQIRTHFVQRQSIGLFRRLVLDWFNTKFW